MSQPNDARQAGAADEDSSSQTVLSIRVHDTAMVRFAPTEGSEDIVGAYAYMERALQDYLLARYAFLHKMHSAFMISSFWAVEYALLSLLRLQYKTKEELLGTFESHSLTKYWEAVKGILPVEQRAAMEKFDSYITRVQGHFKERYAGGNEDVLTYTAKRPGVKVGTDQQRAKFDREAPLSLSEFDHFMNFMFHDIAPDRVDVSVHLSMRLAMYDSAALYLEQNDYAIIYPNKKYHGELGAGQKERS